MVPDSEPVDILLAEDNPGDVKLTRKALDEGDIDTNLHVVTDGVEALQFLRSEGEYSETPRPDLLLLDLNMPRKDGEAVLAERSEDPSLSRIPVVVLTSSDAPDDVATSYDLHANAYLTKPVEFDEFLAVIDTLETFLLDDAELPTE